MALGKMQPIREYPENLKYRIQESVKKNHHGDPISQSDRRTAFTHLVGFLFTHHLTFVTDEGESIRGVSGLIDRLIEESLHFYRHRQGDLSVTDYVTDILDIAHHAKIPVALK